MSLPRAIPQTGLRLLWTKLKWEINPLLLTGSLILNKWHIKHCLLEQRVNYATSFHCILFIGRVWITPACCAPNCAGLAFILAEQLPLCNILIHITVVLSVKPFIRPTFSDNLWAEWVSEAWHADTALFTVFLKIKAVLVRIINCTQETCWFTSTTSLTLLLVWAFL